MSQKLLLAFLLLFLTKTSSAQTSPEEILNKFFDIYKNGQCDKALDYLFSTNKHSSDSQDDINSLKENLKSTILLNGDFYGYEVLSTKHAGKSLILITVIAKYDRAPLTFRILFYNPNNKWEVQNFKFDNKIDEELEEASKTYRSPN